MRLTPLILVYSITTHKSQSMTAHNGIVYEPYHQEQQTKKKFHYILSPIRPDHFINRNFTAEDIKINEFYSNLNKTFNNPDEEL